MVPEDKSKYYRLSIAYLFSISIDGKYLLVKNSKRESFQPVGGCYKYFEGAKKFLNKINYIAEKTTEDGRDVEKDFRIYIPKENLPTFIKWYEKGLHREIGFFREFSEELFDEGILDYESFGSPQFELKEKGSFNIFEDKYFKIETAMPMDIVSLNLTEEQRQQIVHLTEVENPKYVFATAEDILACGIIKDGKLYDIGGHTKKILDKTLDKPKDEQHGL
ncbi:MAG: hypothetical protein AB7S44_01345 [Spirochaetales bacterium]